MLELYKQAQVPDTAIDPSNNMPYETTRFSADKFAELIVSECAKLQYKNVIVGGVSDYNRGRRELAEEILKHFGVEE